MAENTSDLVKAFLESGGKIKTLAPSTDESFSDDHKNPVFSVTGTITRIFAKRNSAGRRIGTNVELKTEAGLKTFFGSKSKIGDSKPGDVCKVRYTVHTLQFGPSDGPKKIDRLDYNIKTLTLV